MGNRLTTRNRGSRFGQGRPATPQQFRAEPLAGLQPDVRILPLPIAMLPLPDPSVETSTLFEETHERTGLFGRNGDK
jgi:hypothetical protein